MTVILVIALKFHSWHFKSYSRVSACREKGNACPEENGFLMLFHLDQVLKSCSHMPFKREGGSK